MRNASAWIKPSRWRFLAIVGLLAFAVSVWFNVYVRTALRADVEIKEQQSLRLATSSYGEQIEQRLLAIELAMKAMALDILVENYSPREMHLTLARAQAAHPIVRVFGITDSKGSVIHSSRSDPAPAVNLSERDYVAYYLNGGDRAVFVSGPVRNVVDGQWQFSMSIPIKRKDGLLAGVLTAVVDPHAIIAKLENSALPGDYFTLADERFLVIARRPWVDALIGTSFAQAQIYSQLRAEPRGDVVGMFKNFVTGETRVGAARRIFHGELVFSSSRGVADALVHWDLFEEVVLFGTLFMCSLIALVIWFLQRRLGEAEVHSRELSDLNLRLTDESAKVTALASVKSDFLANMSHEIRTPLNAILGLTQVLVRSPLRTEDHAVVNQIMLSGRFMSGIIDDILTFSKLEAGRLELESTPFDFDQVTQALATIMSANTNGKPVETLIGIAPEVPLRLIGDPLRLQQVLINLVGNALKFTERGFVALRATAVERSGDRVVIRIAVEDSGIGMTAEQCGALFQPFTQADASTTRRFGGTGLGLVISKRLVEMMGGTIGVRSTPGSGSEFWITLPMRVPDEDAVRPLPPALHVLVVDDSDLSRQFLSGTVRSLGWAGEIAESGEAAIGRLRDEQAAGRPCDVVVVDWRMPGMDGLATVRRIRSDETLSQLPIVVTVTAHDRDEVLSQPGAELLDAVLVKPVTGSALHDAVAAASARRHGVPRGPALAVAHPRLRGLRLLVVEDNPINQDVARRLLGMEGAAVTIADHGRAAVDLLAADAAGFDLVLMDAQMPVMDGFEATRQIRERLGLRRLPVIALTAGVLQAERQRCLDAGMDDFVAKPFDADMLVACILRLAPAVVAGAGTEPAAARSSREPAPSSIAGIDLRVALGRVGGDWPLLRDLLRQLAPRSASAASEGGALLRSGRLDEARRHFHALRGGSAQVGALELAQVAGDLEQAAAEGREADWPVLLERLERCAAELLGGLATVPGGDASPPAAAGAPDQARIDAFRGLLAREDLAAVDCLAEIEPHLAAIMPVEALAALKTAVEELDYKHAEAIIEQWVRKT